MPAHGRIVIPGIPHHVTQRGNRRQRVFFGDHDKAFYLRVLLKNASKRGVVFWAYCLMDNHVHFVAVPKDEAGLSDAFGNTHKFYTKTINEREKWKGFLWQGRFSSFPMDETYLFNSVRYIETNPVRAKLVRHAAEWKWSSAKAHIERIADPVIQPSPLDGIIRDWKSYLESRAPLRLVKEFHEHAKSGLPLGSNDFLDSLEKLTGLSLRKKKPGPKKKRTKKNSVCV